MIEPGTPALTLAPMDGITDAPMRNLQGELGAFSFAVSEFVRVSNNVLPPRVFLRDVPEVRTNCRTDSGLRVQVQVLGGEPNLMAASALNALKAGADAIDLNFGCPAPTVNRSDGGASLLRQPDRIREVVFAVRQAVPKQVPVSAKLRLGWDDIEDACLIARKAKEGGADWVTVHARTRTQRYDPPVFWSQIGQIRRDLDIPVVANGDIWNIDDLRRCQEQTGCIHFMLGRGALANPWLSWQAAHELGIETRIPPDLSWPILLRRFAELAQPCSPKCLANRFKQWLNLADRFGDFPAFDVIKHLNCPEQILEAIQAVGTER